MPDFASLEYWDNRFEKDSKPFDWLVPATALRDVTQDMIEAEALQNAEILHIGAGTSECFVLRKLVSNPEQIHNVDYSDPAVAIGQTRERELLIKEDETDRVQDLLEIGDNKHDSVQLNELPKSMRWSCMNLLDLRSTLDLHRSQLQAGKLYDLVLDKSTSDSIGCGADLHLTLPYPLSINGWTRRLQGSGTTQAANVHPLHILAVHLAALTTPRTGRWLAISYSEDRFPFLPPFPPTTGNGLLSDDVIKAGFPHPHQLWRLETKQQIALDGKEETLAERKKRLSLGYLHRPRVSHWLYVLKRTDALVTA
ncbi:hypothetical protein DOTSEDRAFT_69149 [Dothistroma septosporum NZE10]|uniref:Methyltransferase domain-containing protein n=1 Tax=Dothistroma septosporum (strain NZE10 / CBS 128990) TaxID=675120 RepID=N1PUE4_DOTSN|nr:hypothetical protein DOTSEDRAFT_69149 [Dothistroma septosporum NZE10]